MKIGRKLSLLSLISSFLALSLTSSLYCWFDYRHQRASIQRGAVVLASVVGEQSQAALAFKDTKAATEILGALDQEHRVRYAALHLQDGTLLAEYLRPGGEPKDRGLTISRPVNWNGDTIGQLVMTVSLAELFDRLRVYILFSAAATVAGSLLASVLTRRIRRSIVMPMEHLVNVANEVSAAKNYRIRANRTSSDELGTMVEAFNEMLSVIEQRDRLLSEHGRNLERMVDQRTRELADAKVKAEEATKLKSQFLANMSHEVRTPLNAIIGLTDLVLETELLPDQKDHLELIRGSSGSLLRILNDILDFSKIEAGKLDIEVAPFHLVNEIKSAVVPFTIAAEEKGIAFELEIEKDIPTRVLGDAARIKQVIMNLVGNSVKFTERGGVQVSVRSEPKNASEFEMQIRIQDTGIGIPKDKLKDIFQAFVQADGSTTRRFGGTGLGLSICQQLVELMEGGLSVESEYGKGSCFTVRIPFRLAPELSTPTVTISTVEPARTIPPLQILLAEDNSVNQLLAVRLLEKRGHTVSCVQDGNEALDLLSKVKFDLVLMDVQMPNLGGLEATRILRDRERTTGKRIPVIAMTAHAMKGDREACLDAGMDGYVSKPLRAAALFEEIESCLKN
jgi:signal transduction histidine kinase/CheY-like chemotaxis protein